MHFTAETHVQKPIDTLPIGSNCLAIKVSYWIDRNGVFSGDNYKEKIVDAILSCKLFLFISSKNSNVSKHTVREVGIAFQSYIPIIPVKIDDADFAKRKTH